jgi:hypothetical protein
MQSGQLFLTQLLMRQAPVAQVLGQQRQFLLITVKLSQFQQIPSFVLASHLQDGLTAQIPSWRLLLIQHQDLSLQMSH